MSRSSSSLKKLFIFVGWIFIISLHTPVYADECQEWFADLGLNPQSPDCELTCAAADVDMGSFHCPNRCPEFCQSSSAQTPTGPPPSTQVSKPVIQCGSWVEQDSLTLGEHINLVGVDFYLSYRSYLPEKASALKQNNFFLGGWSLSSVHFYDFSEQILYYGSGRKQKKKARPLQNAQLLVFDDSLQAAYVFNAEGLHLKTLHGLTGQEILHLEYNEHNHLLSLRDAFNNTTSFLYHPAEMDSEKKDSDQASSRVFKNGEVHIRSAYGVLNRLFIRDGNLVQVENPNGEIHQMSYNPEGLLVSFKKPTGATKEYSFDQHHRLSRLQDAEGQAKEFSWRWDKENSVVRMVTAEGWMAEYFTRQDGRSILREGRGLDGEWVTYQEWHGERTIDVHPFFKQDITYGPDVRVGDLAHVVQTIELEEGYDVLNVFEIKVERHIEPRRGFELFNYERLKTLFKTPSRTYTHDFHRPSGKEESISPEGRKLVTHLSPEGLIRSIQWADFLPIELIYDGRGRLTELSQGTRRQQLSYNPQGLVASVTNPSLNTRQSLDYDNAHRLTQITLADKRQIRMGYDANGNLTHITPPERLAHRMPHTPTDRLQSYLPPRLGTESATQPTGSLTYNYNKDGDLLRITRSDSQAIEMLWDSEYKRLNAIRTSDGEYEFSYKTGGVLGTVTSPDEVYIEYLEHWPQKTFISIGDDVEVEMEIERNIFGLIGSLTLMEEGPIAFRYDKDDLLTRAGEQRIVRDRKTGLITSTELFNIKETWSYDSQYGELQKLASSFKDQNLFEQSLTRGPQGRVVGIKEEELKGGDSKEEGVNNRELEFKYDVAGRLIETREISSQKNQRRIYTYDANGNRIKKQVEEVLQEKDDAQKSTSKVESTIAYSYDNQDRLLQAGNYHYSYTDHGELKSKEKRAGSAPANTAKKSEVLEKTTYTYDVMGNLKTVQLPRKKVEYMVDGFNRRVQRKEGGKITHHYLWQSQLQMAAELDRRGRLVAQYIYSSREHVPDYMIKGKDIYKLVTDHLGSVRLVVHAKTGEIVQKMTYDEWGKVIEDTQPGFQPFGFAGGLYDPDTGLVRFGARDYDPEVGRWTSKDPILFAGGDTNLYGYVLNDPVNFIDPEGKALIGVSICIGASIYSYFSLFRDTYALKKQLNINRKKASFCEEGSDEKLNLDLEFLDLNRQYTKNQLFNQALGISLGIVCIGLVSLPW